MENENYKGVTSLQEDQLQNNSQQPVEEEMDEEAAAKERLTSNDPTKVVFLSANSEYTRKNGDAKVDIENVQKSVGMGKEELMKYANEPFWVRLRMTLFVLFWVVWLAMLIGSIAIILVAPGCPAAPRLQWWQKTTVYQVMVGSFKDSDGDKKGDLNGLTSKLDYFSDLKVDTLLLSSIFAIPPGPSTSRGVVNFTDISPHYGTFTDFQTLITKADEKKMKIVLEFIPNHTGKEHPWYIKSENGEEPYDDYYIWASSKPATGEPGDEPNNWVNVKGGSAWSWSPQRKKFYLHQFDSTLPDLNLRNPHLRAELQNILRFWLDQGVDGFKVADVDFLFEDKDQHDEPLDGSGPSRTRGQDENLELLREWREVLDNYTETSEEKHTRILLTESTGDNSRSLELYYGKSNDPVVNIPYNLGLTSLHQNSTPNDLYAALQKSFNSTPHGLWPNFVLGTSHHARLLSRVGSSLLDGVHMATLLSNGTPVVYFGDELGMEGGPHAKDHGTEESDGGSILMQWDNTTTVSAGDTAPPGSTITVNAELDHKHSHLSIFKHLLSLREKSAISFGVMEFPLVNDQIFSMLRVKKGTPGYLVVINFSGNDTTVNFSGLSPLLSEKAKVELATSAPGFITDDPDSNVYLNKVHMGPNQAAVLTFVPKDK